MFVNNRLIISFIREPEKNRYLFLLAGGEEYVTNDEEFYAHWHEYRQFETIRAAQELDHYRPLPVTMEIRQTIVTYPVEVSTRHRRQTA